jgi:hypothetical protein
METTKTMETITKKAKNTEAKKVKEQDGNFILLFFLSKKVI